MKKKIVNTVLGISVITIIGWCVGYYCGDNYGKRYMQYKKQVTDLKNQIENLQEENKELNQECTNLMYASSKLLNNNSDNTSTSSNTTNSTNNFNTNELNTYTAGVYTIGKDIEVGTYDIEWVSGDGKFERNTETFDISVYKSEYMGKDENDITKYTNLKLENNQTFEITNNLKVKLIKK